MRVLVTGASGFVGSHLTPALVSMRHDVIALTRDAEGYDGPEDVSMVEADLLDPDSLDGVFDDVDVVYYLVHSMESGGDFA